MLTMSWEMNYCQAVFWVTRIFLSCVLNLAMRVLLDTNIIIHREAAKIVVQDIGSLFNWLDKLHHTKHIHPVTIAEINKLKDRVKRDSFNVKISSYAELVVSTTIDPEVDRICGAIDNTENDVNDTTILNEVFTGVVDLLITEDRGIISKAALLNIRDRVVTISEFLERVAGENPEFADYKVLSVKKEHFATVNLANEFFDSFKEDYAEFEQWFKKKSQEIAYVSRSSDGSIAGFLYIKVEDTEEAYPEITPAFSRKKRLKIGTFKTRFNRSLLGERLLKIVFDNAVTQGVDEIYVTIFDTGIERQWLIKLLEEYGFYHHGVKASATGEEAVFVRSMTKAFDAAQPKLTYPYFSTQSRSFIVPIYPAYHTNLFPDSILRTESPDNFVENEAYRNAISKVYISRSHFKDLKSGDVIVFYRTGGYYAGVVTTIGIVESVVQDLASPDAFIRACRKRSVFTDAELLEHWNYYPNLKPFVVNFLYTYSFPKRVNLKELIELGIIADIKSVPRGFEPLTESQFKTILGETRTYASFIID